MVSWLFICAAIIKYAEKNAYKILTIDRQITLEEVFNIYKELNPCNKEADFLSNWLIAYVEDRKKFFKEAIKKEDYHGRLDTNGDKDFVFEYENKSLV